MHIDVGRNLLLRLLTFSFLFPGSTHVRSAPFTISIVYEGKSKRESLFSSDLLPTYRPLDPLERSGGVRDQMGA